MSASYYVRAYHAACQRLRDLYQDAQSEDWLEELGKVRASWKWSVAGMLTQEDSEDPDIWNALGDAFLSGNGIERDPVKGECLLRKAAESGHVAAMVHLGAYLWRELSKEQQVAESLTWFRRAAEKGDASGMVYLGFAYRDGMGVAIDERAAVEWFIKAHEAGSKSAAELAGRLFAYPLRDHGEAVKWLRIAAQQGYDTANYPLAVIHEDRDSPEYDPYQAFECWSVVAERRQGSSRFEAMLALARCCRDGVGTHKDRREAKRWLDRVIAEAPKGKLDFRRAMELRAEIDEELF